MVISALTVGFAKGNGFELGIATPRVLDCIRQGLANPKLEIPCLKLAGAICGTLNGALFIEPCIPMIAPFLTASRMSQELSVMFFASFSLLNPISAEILKAANVVLELVKEGQCFPYSLIYLANICVSPEGARICADNLEVIIGQLVRGDDSLVSLAFLALERMSSVSEVVRNVQSEDVWMFLNATERHWRGPYEHVVLVILERLNGCTTGREVIKSSPFPVFLKERLNDVSVMRSGDRVNYLRILGQLGVILSR
jgi:hypothetical protein